jgi:predicted MPP superfamily phosphohydrolase
MHRNIAVIFFLFTVIGITLGLHYYIWYRLFRETALGPPWTFLARILLLLLGSSLPLSFVFVRQGPTPFARSIFYPAYIWMGLLFLLFVLLLLTDLIRVGWGIGATLLKGGDPLFQPSQRIFFARVVAGAIATFATGSALLGLHQASQPPKIKHLRITLDRLPQKLDRFTLVQLTDLHLGPLLGRDWLEGIVQRVNALRPQLVAITGDLIDGPVEKLRDTVAPLQQLKAPFGVFFVTGNHEYYSGVDAWIEELERLGIRVLRNERVEIGQGPTRFDLAGIDDYNARGFSGHGPNLSQALTHRHPQRELILLAHQPRAIFEAEKQGVGLLLSGHTHGGQIWPMTYLVKLQQPYVSGLIRHGRTQLYISEGTGFWGPPMRLGTSSEITHITLEARTSGFRLQATDDGF